MPDKIVEIKGGCLQHGTDNDRVYIMSLKPESMATVVDAAEKLAAEHSYSKIFAKVPGRCRDALKARGYVQEAFIPGPPAAELDTSAAHQAVASGVAFMSRFLKPAREDEVDQPARLRILGLAEGKKMAPNELNPMPLPEEYSCRVCVKEDCRDMAELYRLVFASYPFPIDDPAYLGRTMDSHVQYFGVWEKGSGRLVAWSSAEMDLAKGMVEMTDFATNPDWRGQGLGVFLLQQMEVAMRQRQLPIAYTIARAASPGMNIVFAKHGYIYGGTLVSNTNICGKLESMNIWYKHL